MASPEGKYYGLPVGQYVTSGLGGRWTPEKAKFFNAWARAEGTAAAYNPFATTKRGYPSTQFNETGVKNYQSLAVGQRATLDTVQNGFYSDLANLLKSDVATAEQLATAVANSPWGTGAGVLRVLGVKGATAYEQRKGAAVFEAQKGFLDAPFEADRRARAIATNMQIQALHDISTRLVQQTNALLTPSQGWLETLKRTGPGGQRVAESASRFTPLALPPEPTFAEVPDEPEITDSSPGAPAPLGSKAVKGGSFLNQSVGGIKWTNLGGPEAHHARALGNWQSDNAWDLGVPVGTPVYAVSGGTVGPNIGVQSSRPKDGERLTLNGKNNSYWYGHLSKILVRPGQKVKKGDLIGYSGASQNGVAHLHLGVEKV